MKDAEHCNLDGVVVGIDGFGLCEPRLGRSGWAAASKGLMALFRSTSSAVIARSPVADAR
jgi:hypothetical protein